MASSPGNRTCLLDTIKPGRELVPRVRQQAVVEVVVACQGEHVLQGEVPHDGRPERVPGRGEQELPCSRCGRCRQRGRHGRSRGKVVLELAVQAMERFERMILASGRSVILDGNFGDYARREPLWRLAGAFSARMIAIRTSFICEQDLRALREQFKP